MVDLKLQFAVLKLKFAVNVDLKVSNNKIKFSPPPLPSH